MPWPRVARKLLTRSAAESVSEMAMCPHIVAPQAQCARHASSASSTISNRPSFSTGTERAAAQAVGVPGISPCAGASRQLPAEPGGRIHSMGAAKRLKTGIFHIVAYHQQVEAYPGPLVRPPGFAGDHPSLPRPFPAAAHAPPGARHRHAGPAGDSARRRSTCSSHGPDRKVDVGLGGEAPDAESQGAFRQAAVAPEGAQHVGGLARLGIAGRAGRYGEVRKDRRPGSRPRRPQRRR